MAPEDEDQLNEKSPVSIPTPREILGVERFIGLESRSTGGELDPGDVDSSWHPRMNSAKIEINDSDLMFSVKTFSRATFAKRTANNKGEACVITFCIGEVRGIVAGQARWK